MRAVIVLLILITLPLTTWAQLTYPVQKTIEGGDTLVIMTKAQADQLVGGFALQNKKIENLEQRLKHLYNKHSSLIEQYASCKRELIETNKYNDSLLNYLGDNMALLYKPEPTSDVFFVDLKYYSVDVFRKGTIFLTSMSEVERRKLDEHLLQYPLWRHINIANEMNPEYRKFCDFIRLYPDRYKTTPTKQSLLRP